MMKTVVTADPHFDHDRVLELCELPFKTLSEWERFVLEQLNTWANRQDRLIIVGDFAFKRPGYWRTLIRCKHVHLVVGNHDPIAKSKNVFGGNYHEQYVTKLCGENTFFSHYPTAFWPGSHRRWFHCYGHIHDHPRREGEMNRIWPERRSMDVSLFSAKRLLGDYRPFIDSEIYEMLGKREGHDPI